MKYFLLISSLYTVAVNAEVEYKEEVDNISEKTSFTVQISSAQNKKKKLMIYCREDQPGAIKVQLQDKYRLKSTRRADLSRVVPITLQFDKLPAQKSDWSTAKNDYKHAFYAAGSAKFIDDVSTADWLSLKLDLNASTYRFPLDGAFKALGKLKNKCK